MTLSLVEGLSSCLASDLAGQGYAVKPRTAQTRTSLFPVKSAFISIQILFIFAKWFILGQLVP